MSGKSFRRRILAAGLVVALGGVASADRIELRSAARVEPGSPVRLADVARLGGERAEALGSVVVLDAGDARGDRIGIDDLRRALDAHGVNWALLSLRGGMCELIELEARPAIQAGVAPSVAEIPDGPTVRTFVEQRLRETFGVSEASRIRYRFEDRDADLLSMPLDGGAGARLVEAHTTGASSRVPVSVSVYDGDRLVERRVIRVEVEIRREVCIATAGIRRGDMVDPTTLMIEDRWMAVDVTPATLQELSGAEARANVEAGEVVTALHVEPPLAIRRGERVMVHYLTGGVILQAKCRALEDGRVGEMIRLEVIGGAKRLEARVDARGRAVVRDVATEAASVVDTPAGDLGSPGVQVTRAASE